MKSPAVSGNVYICRSNKDNNNKQGKERERQGACRFFGFEGGDAPPPEKKFLKNQLGFATQPP